MKKQHESLETDAKPKMLFNSDGFNFLVKFVTVLFTIIGAVLIVVLKIIGALCASSAKSNQSDDDNSIYPIDDVIVRRDENGTGYNADGDII